MSRIALAFRWTLLIVSSAVVGCDPAPVPPPTASAAPTATTAAPVTSLPPPQRPTVVPLESEWEAAPAIAVQGAAALGCAGQELPGWFRLSCSSPPDRGAPEALVEPASNQPLTTRIQRGLVLVQTRLLPGTVLTGTFVWADEAHALAVRWPHDAARPSPVGAFSPTTYRNPCKPLGLAGHGTRHSPCLLDAPPAIDATFRKPGVGHGAERRPSVELHNRTPGVVVAVDVQFTAEIPGATKPWQSDSHRQTFSGEATISPDERYTIMLGPEESAVPKGHGELTARVVGYALAGAPTAEFSLPPESSDEPAVAPPP